MSISHFYYILWTALMYRMDVDATVYLSFSINIYHTYSSFSNKFNSFLFSQLPLLTFECNTLNMEPKKMPKKEKSQQKKTQTVSMLLQLQKIDT